MDRFFSILIASFISVLCALAAWWYVEGFIVELEAQKTAAETMEKKEESEKVVQQIVDKIRYEWKVEERTNPVTGEKVATATRFSEDIGSALTFRCYGLETKRFDILVSFPESVDWNSYKGDYYSEMKFRVDDRDLTSIKVDRSSSSIAVLNLKEASEKKYKEYPSLLKSLREKNKLIREFKRIGKASVLAASIPDGTIYQQTILIDLDGIQEAVRPVLELCGKKSI